RCAAIGCHQLIPMDKKYCSLHHANEQATSKYERAIIHKKYNEQRYNDENIVFTRFYKTRAFRKIRPVVKAKASGLCQECLKQGKIRPGKIADHIVPIRTGYGWLHRLDLDNLQWLCQDCHNQKTAKERKNTNASNH
ncbi:MAG: HNH endonuclease, partial [Sporolactobacillus sp.]